MEHQSEDTIEAGDAQEAPRESGMSFVARFVAVFFSPSALGDELRERPTWLAPMGVALVLAAIAIMAMPADIYEEMMRAQALESGQPSPDFMTGNVMKIAGLVSVVVFFPFIQLAFSGLLTVIFAFVLGDRGRFKQYFSVSVHAALISSVLGLVLIPLRIAMRDPQASLGLGTFLRPILEDGRLLRLATVMDFFVLWTLVVMGIMISRIDGNRGAGAPVAILITVYMVIAGSLAMVLPV